MTMTIGQPNQSDVIVVGAGIGGLVAAVRAAELGLRVCILEQGDDEAYPCNTRYSGGIVHAAFHDVNRPADELSAILAKATDSAADSRLVATVATDGRRLLAFLQTHGVRFMRFSTAEAHRWCMAPPRPIGPGLDWKGRGPDVLLKTLAQALRKHGGTIQFGARAQSLQMENGRCVGVIGTLKGAEHRWPAKAVVLADGGFQANRAMLREHIGPNPDAILQRGASNGHGDGLKMATAAGAATRGLTIFYGHLLGRDALTNPDVWPYPELDGVAATAIVVTPDGKRFFDEGLGGISLTNAIARLRDPASTTLICDAAIWEGPGRSARFPANPYLEKFGGTLLRADTLAELAAKANIDGAGLAKTVQDYNAALDAGQLGALTPARSTKKTAALPITGAPYIAIPLCAGITYTMGGIVIDGDGQAQRADGTAIPGLYASGTTTAGLDVSADGASVGYVGGLIKAVFGLRASERIAKEVGVKAL
ncbi:MAG TPA: FAD-dependent oxidoreductase [Pseudolabrys sp.]|nr:FAD-dependent oxidoreductase [Pseudolabrys sp.]